MQLVVEILGFLRDTRRFGVRGDGFAPIADAREDVRRHVLGMGRRRRDLGVASRSLEALLGDRRIVVEVDQVVRHAGMLRLTLGDRLEDRRALELAGVGLVGRRSRGVERERVVNLRLVIVRIALRQLLHGLRIGHDAGAMIDLLVVGVHDAERIQIVALALLSWRRRSFPWRSSAAPSARFFTGVRDVGIPQQAERAAPIGDAALGIGFQHILEGSLRRAVPERMLIQHCLVEQFLGLRFAGRFEIDLSKLFVVRIDWLGK